MPELIDESGQIESTTIGVHRTSATVKGGRRFSFGALVVVGDRRGRVGYGYGKSNEVPAAIEKAQKAARKAMRHIPMAGSTLPHQVEGAFSSAKVRLIPASPGTGVVAGTTVRAVLELAGVTDCLTKCYGSTNSMNTIKAVFDGLGQVRTPELIASLRGVELGKTEIQLKVEKGAAFMPAKRATAPKLRAESERPQRGRGGGGRSRRGPRGGGEGGAPRGAPESGGGDAPSGGAPQAS